MAPGLDSGPSRGGGPDGPVGEGSQLRRFLRYGQIFSAAVHELIGSRCLGEVFQQPLTLPQLHLVKTIARNGKHRMSDVAAFLGVSTPAATKCVDKLERLGLVTRTRSTSDRRMTLLSASAEAQTLVREYERVQREHLLPILSVFEPKEIDHLIELLERFAVELYTREHAESGSCLWCGAYFEDDCAIARIRGGCPYQEIQSPDSAEASRS
jgi:DNA-binding MarR family transcriptional regulator